MLRISMLATALALVLVPAAYAQEKPTCDEASMMKMQGEMDKMTDPAMKEKKDMAMKEMEMAKQAMTDKKMDECSMHMGNAMKGMKKS